MFTGIIEELGTITAHSSGVLAIRAPMIASDVALGDSVATNGVCLTVTRIEGDRFWVDYSATTREATTVGSWRVGDNVNLGSRLEGTNKNYGTHIIVSETTYKQAKGVVSETRRVSTDAAFDVLRRHARDHNARLADVARDVVERRLDL